MTDWYEWGHRRSHVIQNADNAGTDYQVRIHVYRTGTSASGDEVHLNGLCRPDFGDIRFTGSDGVVKLPYWIESKNGDTDAVFWVKVADNLNNDDRTIYIYYDNPDAKTTSNGDATFLLFDDFEGSAIDTGKWDVTYPGQFNVANSWANCTGSTSSFPCLTSKAKVPTRDIAVEAKLDVTSLGSASFSGWRTLFSPNVDGCCWYTESAFYDRYVYSNGSGSWQTGPNKGMTTGSVRSNVYITYNKIRWKAEGARNFDDTFENPTNDADRNLLCFATNVNYDVNCDYIFVRKYVDPEPQHSSWGASTEKPQ